MVEADEIVVLGGGPAGCLAGACLSRAGYRVSLVSDFKVRPAHEGLSGRTIEALQLAGFRRSLDRVGPPVPRTLHWNGETAQANEESLIERGPFDEGLRADALAAGVRVIHGRALEARHISRGWSVRIACIDGTRTELNGGFLVEARGRTAPTGRRRGRRGPPATALLSTWELPTNTRSFTSVAAFPQGWAWWASGGCGRSYMQLVVSGERGTIPGKAALEEFYDELLNQVAEAPGWLAGARRVGRIAGRSAGTIIHGELIGDRLLRLQLPGAADHKQTPANESAQLVRICGRSEPWGSANVTAELNQKNTTPVKTEKAAGFLFAPICQGALCAKTRRGWLPLHPSSTRSALKSLFSGTTTYSICNHREEVRG